LVKLIKEEDNLYDYGECFKKYLEKYTYIHDVLFDDDFFNNFEKLVNSEILGKKRHV
jgi:hypothetical protein